MSTWWRKIIILLISGLLFIPVPAMRGTAIAVELEEYRLKAAFLYNFAKFVEWPPHSFSDGNAPVVMCVLGEDPFGASVGEIQNKMVGVRKFLVRRIRNTEESEGCQMLFISLSEKDRLEGVLRSLRGSAVLTVSDIPDFSRLGGMIGFIRSGDKIRFEINLGSARSSRIEISSKLLKLAETVRDN